MAALIDGTGAPPRNDRVIVTTGERITAVVPAAGFSVPAGAEVVELRGKFLVPGFVNSHVHLATLAEPAHARAYLRRELYSGVTALRDMAGDVRLLAELKREAEFNEIPSPDIYYVALMAGPEFFADPRTHDAARGRLTVRGYAGEEAEHHVQHLMAMASIALPDLAAWWARPRQASP